MILLRSVALSCFVVLVLGAVGLVGQVPTEAPRGLPCANTDEIRFVCNLISPEDLAVIPGAEWVIASGNRAGGRIHLVNIADKTASTLFPGAPERHDAATYPTCPGPIDPGEGDEFAAHGLYLDPGQGGMHTLYVVHHGHRESIEVFEVDARSRPTLTWVGCAVTPEGEFRLNSVAALPGGGFATTSPGTGDVWEWQTDSGWTKVPGSDGTAPNGIEVSPDGRWLYIAGWREEKMTRLSRGQTPVQKDVIELDFRPDNLRMSLDGSVIYAAGHSGIQSPRRPLEEFSNVAEIDPDTLAVQKIFQHPAIEGFVASTTAIVIGDELWLGSHRGERIAIFDAP